MLWKLTYRTNSNRPRAGLWSLLLAGALVAAGPAVSQEEAADPAAAPEPSAPPSLLTRAMAELDASRIDRAIEILEQEGATEEDDPRVGALLGALYLEVDRNEEAMEILEPLATQENPDLAVLYNAGRAASRLERYEEAERFLGVVARVFPAGPAARELGFLHFRRGRYMPAYLSLKPWIRSQPTDAEAARAAATCAVRLGRGAEAEQLLRLLPTEEPAVKLLWSNALLLKDDPWSALALAKELGEAPPPGLEPQILTLLADIYFELEQPSLVIEDLTGKTERRPLVAVRLARALRQEGRLAEALELLTPFSRGLVDDDPTVGRWIPGLGAEVALEYGRLLTGLERHAEAARFLRASTDMASQEPEAWRALASALAETEDMDGAREARDRADRIERLSGGPTEETAGPPDPTGRQLRRSQALLEIGAESEALRIARQEKLLAPGDPRPYLAEAQMLVSLDRRAEALGVMDTALEAFSEVADVHYYRGVVQMSLNQTDEAEPSLRRALELSPRHAPALTDLAALLIQLERTSEARDLIDRVLAIRPGDPAATRLLEQL